MATVKTLYTALGLDPTASSRDIEEAYTRAKLRHAQVKEPDEAQRIAFQAVQQAYTTLSDFDARAVYDQRLKRTGIQVSGEALAVAGTGTSASTRNLIILGVIVLLASGMWAYNSHQRTKAEKEIAERALKLIEEEKLRQAAAAQRAEEERLARQAEADKRRAEMEARQFQADAARVGNQAQMELRRASMQAEQEKRRADMEKQNAERTRQMQQRQQEAEAQRRLQMEKMQLRQMCMQRYGTPDC